MRQRPWARATMLAGGQVDQAALRQAEQAVAFEWHPGDVILDLYEVRKVTVLAPGLDGAISAGFGASDGGVFGAADTPLPTGGPRAPAWPCGVRERAGADTYKVTPSSTIHKSVNLGQWWRRSVWNPVSRHSRSRLRGGVGLVSAAGDSHNTPGAWSPRSILMSMSIGAAGIVPGVVPDLKQKTCRN